MSASYCSLLLFVCALSISTALGYGDGETRYYCGPRPSVPSDIPLAYIPPLKAGHDMKLFFTQHLIRHGDRTGFSDSCWPGDHINVVCDINFDEIPTDENDKYYHAGLLFRKTYEQGQTTYKNCPSGYLTPKGFHQHVHNGEELRRAYVESGFLSEELSDKEVYVRSDDTSRTLMSVQALLSGMYPPSHTEAFAHVVDIHTRETAYSDITPSSTYCPRLAGQISDAMNSSEFQQHLMTHTNPLKEKIEDILGDNVTVDMEPPFFNFFDCVNIHTCHGFPTPISDDLVFALTEDVSYQIGELYRLPNRTYAGQLGIGFLVEEFLEQLQAVLNGSSSLKSTIFSGHDTSIMPFLSVFDLYDNQWTPYSSVLSLEYYRDEDNANFVRIIYNREVLSIPTCKTVHLSNGEYTRDLCRLEEFVAIANKVVVADRVAFCST